MSAESNPEWFDIFRPLSEGFHRIDLVRDWDAYNLRPPKPWDRWSLVLVDHTPGERRVADALRLRDYAEFLVVHDTEEPSYGWTDLNKFRYRKTYSVVTPWTTIVSDYRDPEELFR